MNFAFFVQLDTMRSIRRNVRGSKNGEGRLLLVALAWFPHEAPVLLLACGAKGYEPWAHHPRASTATAHGSIYLAVQNMLLTCRALGIGTVITTTHCFFEEELKHELGIPEEMEIAALLPLGYPRGKFGPTRRRPVEEVMFWDRWGHTTPA